MDKDKILPLALGALAVACCCIATCSASFFSPTPAERAKKGFDELNRFMVKNIPLDNLDMQLIESHWFMLSKGAKRAATIVQVMKNTEHDIDLPMRRSNQDETGTSNTVKVKVTKQCNDHTLKLARQLVGSVDPSGTRKVDRLVKYYALKAFESCYSLFDDKFNTLNEALDRVKLGDNWSSFVFPRLSSNFDHTEDPIPLPPLCANREIIEIGHLKEIVTNPHNISTHINSPGSLLLAFHFKHQLAKGDARNVNYGDGKNYKSSGFQQIFNKYLVEPCQYYNNVTSDFFESMYAVMSFKNYESLIPFVESISEDFQNAMYRYQVCKNVLENKNYKKDLYSKIVRCEKMESNQ